MAVRTNISRQAAEEEAEVDVLRSHLETRAQMTRKIEAALLKVVNNGNNLDGAVQSLGTETKKLQELIQSASLSAGRPRNPTLADVFSPQTSGPHAPNSIGYPNRRTARTMTRRLYAWVLRRPD